MLSLPGIVITCALFGAFYFIARFIGSKITSSGKSAYIFYAFLILVGSAVVLSTITELSIQEMMGSTEGFYYFTAIFLGAYYGFVGGHRAKNKEEEK